MRPELCDRLSSLLGERYDFPYRWRVIPRFVSGVRLMFIEPASVADCRLLMESTLSRPCSIFLWAAEPISLSVTKGIAELSST